MVRFGRAYDSNTQDEADCLSPTTRRSASTLIFSTSDSKERHVHSLLMSNESWIDSAIAILTGDRYDSGRENVGLSAQRV